MTTRARIFDDICDIAIDCGCEPGAPGRVVVCTTDYPESGMAHAACAVCAPKMGALLDEVFGAHTTRPTGTVLDPRGSAAAEEAVAMGFPIELFDALCRWIDPDHEVDSTTIGYRWSPDTRAEALRLCKALKLIHAAA